MDKKTEKELKEWWNNLDDWWKTTFKQYIFHSLRVEAEKKSNELTLKELELVLKIESVNLWGEIHSLEPLRKLTHLKKFVYMDDELMIDSLEPILDLKEIESINIVGTKIHSLEPISNYFKLKELYCFKTKIKSIKPIMNLHQMKLLWIGNQVPLSEINEFKLQNPDCKINPKY